MGVQRLDTFPEPRIEGKQWMFPVGSMEQAIEVLSNRTYLDPVKNEDKTLRFMMPNQTEHPKVTRQTVLKISCGSNEDDPVEPKSVKEDRILSSLEYGLEKGDVSKEDSLSLEWQGRAVKLYQRSKKIKTVESVLGQDAKCADEMWPTSKQPLPTMHKTETKNYPTKNMIPVKATTLKEITEKDISTDLHNLKQETDNKDMENMVLLDPVKSEKILIRKKAQDDRNTMLRDARKAERTFEDNTLHANDFKASKNNKNDEVKKNSAFKKNIATYNDDLKSSTCTTENIGQEMSEEENNKKVDPEVPVKEKDVAFLRSSVIETEHTHAYPPNKLRNFIILISKDQDGGDREELGEKGESERMTVESALKQSEGMKDKTSEDQPGEKQETDDKNYQKKKIKGNNIQSYSRILTEINNRAPMIDLRVVKQNINSCTQKYGRQQSDGRHNGQGDSSSNNTHGASNGGSGGDGSMSGSGASGFSGGSSWGFNGAGAGDGDGSRDPPRNSFEHKDGPGDIDNPDRDKDDTETNGAVGHAVYNRQQMALIAGTGGGRAVAAPRVPGYVQSTVAQFSPPRTPPCSPTLQRVKGVRGRATSRSPPTQRRGSPAGAAAGMGPTRHGTVEALEGYDIYSAVGLLVSEDEIDRDKANIVLEQFNICLPRSIRPNHGNNTDGCTICSLLSSLLKHAGRCVFSRKADGCLRCRQVDIMLHHHVDKCMENMAADDNAQAEANSGAAAQGAGQTRAINGICKVPLCFKIRQKLKVQKAGRESFNLDEIWKTPKLWDAIRDYLGKVFTPHVDENSEVALSVCLESIGATAWSDIPTRFSSLVTSQRTGDSPRHTSSTIRSSHSNVAVGVGGDMMVLSLSSTGSGGQTAQTSRIGSRSGSRHGSESNSIPDFVEGPFSGYMNEGPWQIPTFDETTTSGMQPQGLGQRSPEVVHYLNGNGADQLPGALFQSTFTSFQPMPAAMSLVDEMYAPDSLPAFPVQSEGQELITLGKGHVAYGDRRHLVEIAGYWEELREQFKNDEIKLDKKFWEGIILAEYMSTLCLDEGEYIKHKQWERSLFLGSGISGKTYLAVDGRTGHFFCVKKVPLLKFQSEEMTTWSLLEHRNIVKLYGVLRRGQKIYFLEEFIDGGSLQQHIDTYQRLSVNMSLQYLRQILQALVYLQQKYILHEDIKADNILLRAQSMDLVLVDFGLSRQLPPDNPFVPAGENPVGGATQWSPEKAASEGHSFPAEVWAACCCLLHMLTGSPPWVTRYPAAGALHFIIKIQAPPIEDIPVDLDARLKNLFSQGWNRDVSQRWSAQQLLVHNAFQILEQKPVPRGRVASLTDPQIVGISNHQARPSPLTNQNGSSTVNRIPAFKLKEQDASSLAEMALSLVSDVDGYLASIDPPTNRKMATMKDEERIGTPVKVKKKTKSPTSAEKQPLSIARQFQRSISNESESNKSFEIDTDILKDLHSVDMSIDEVFHSEIKEPDFGILKSFNETMARPVTTGTEQAEYNISRSHLPALSIFDTMSSSNSREESSLGARQTSALKEALHTSSTTKEKRSPVKTQPPVSPSRSQQIKTAAPAQLDRNQGTNLPVLSIFDSTSSTSQSLKEERKPSTGQEEEAETSFGFDVMPQDITTSHIVKEQGPIPQPVEASVFETAPRGVKSSPVLGRKETSPLVQRKQTSPRPVRVITGRQGPPREFPPRNSPPSSTFEPLDVQERKRILDFEDLYTARREGEMVGIGAKAKVSTFASPAFDTMQRTSTGNNEKEDAQGRQRPGLVLVEAETNQKESDKAVTPPASNGKDSSGKTSPGSTNSQKALPVQSPKISPSSNPRRIERPVMFPVPNTTQASNCKPPGSTGLPREPIYEAVICKRADSAESLKKGEESEDLYKKHDRTGEITPPYHVLEEFTRTFPRPRGKDHTDSSSTLPRDGKALNPADPLGRSLSEPAYVHNGRPVSPFDRQSSSNSQRSFEVEQEYHSLLEEFYQDQWSRSSETSFGGFTSMPQIQDEDSPEVEAAQIPSDETVTAKDDYDFTNSLDWLNNGYLNSTVAGVRVSFCDDGMNELCSVRVHDTRQRWHEVVLRISAHPTVLQRFPIYTVLRHRHGDSLDLSAPVGIEDSDATVVLQPAGDADDWLWRVRDNHVEYHSEYRGPFMNI